MHRTGVLNQQTKQMWKRKVEGCDTGSTLHDKQSEWYDIPLDCVFQYILGNQVSIFTPPSFDSHELQQEQEEQQEHLVDISE